MLRPQPAFPIRKPEAKTPFSSLFHSLLRPQSLFPIPRPKTSTPFSSPFHSLFGPQLTRIIPVPFPIYIYRNCDSKDVDKTDTDINEADNEGLSPSENGDVIENDTVPVAPESPEEPESPETPELPEVPVVAGDTEDIETEKEKNHELHHYFYEVGSY